MTLLTMPENIIDPLPQCAQKPKSHVVTAICITLGLGLILGLSGCAVMTAGVKKGDERNFSRSLHDVNAGRAIRARMTRAEGFDLKGVDVEVAQGIVVLSGNAPNEKSRIEAERIAWSADRVVQVGNEIFIRGKQGKIRNAKDGALHQAVRAKLIASKQVKARNFNLEVHDGSVYLLGVARTEHELALATRIASRTKGAREVISYVRIANQDGPVTAPNLSGPGYNGQPSQSISRYQSSNNLPSDTIPYRPLSASPSVPRSTANLGSTILDSDAIPSDEPYYLDPVTGERVEIPEGVTPIPYVPDEGIGSLGHGGFVPPNYQPKPAQPAGYQGR